MKTQIITLESHDDLVSVRDRLSWAKTPRILLVWPKGERILLRALDLKVLQRHADALGAQLGLVTRLALARRQAESLGMPVFESAAAAQREAWPARGKRRRRAVRPPRRDLRELRGEVTQPEARWRSSLAVRLLAFAAGVAAVLAVAGIFVPRAAVTLHPVSQTQQVTIPVFAGPSVHSVFVSGSVPAREETIIEESSQSTGVNSQIAVPRTRARGVAHFQNLTQNEVPIPAGTIVRTLSDPPIRFATLNDTHITPGVDQFVEVQIEALEPGASGNVDANQIQAVEGPLGLLAAVSNPEAAGGGTDQKAIGPSQQDRDALRAKLLDSLKARALEDLKKRVGADDVLLADTLTLSQTLEDISDPPPGQPGTKLTMTMRVEYKVQIVSGDDLRQLAESVMNASQPQGFSPVADSLKFENISQPVTDQDGSTHWQIQATRRALQNVDFGFVQGLVRGHSLADARHTLSDSMKWQSPPQISLMPSWWPWLPLIPFRISVAVQ